MANLSDYLELEIIKWVFATADPTGGLFLGATPTAAYVGLWDSTASLSDASTGATAGEPVAANGYARQEVLVAGWSSPADQSTTDNLAAINFGPNTIANWGTVNQVGISNIITRAAGNLWFWGPMTSLAVVVNDTVQFAIGALDIQIDTAAGEMSDYLEETLMDFLFRGVAMPARPTTLHIALFVTPGPTDADSAATEVDPVAHPSYVRVSKSSAIANTVWTNAANTVSNGGAAGAIAFPQALTAWGTVTHVGIYDVAHAGVRNAGNLLFYTPVTNVVVNINDTLQILAGNLTVQVDN